ncbi:MAG: type ISP restriction/modification enzyme [Candidatus Cryosericum sp.]
MTFRVSVEKYLKAVAAQVRQGDAREESYYDALKVLFVELGPQVSNAHTTLTVLPRETEAGNPDMRVWSGDQHVIGYVECKKPEEANLDRVEVSEQLKRYRRAFPNIILTNFLEFRLYHEGDPFGEPVTIATREALTLGKQPPFQHEDQFHELLERFFEFQLPRAYTSQTLAVALADRTRYLQQQVLAELIDDEDHKRSSELVNLMAEFKQVLMSDLTSDTFADLYAQTITYGLFAARMRVTGTFTRQTAIDGIPATIGILRKLFKYISIGDTPERLRVIIDDIADVLAVADTDMVFKTYDKKGRDPVADFYETFLGEYDPAKKKQHGVYYTPQPVVSYIVRSVDQILRDSFGKPDGLADTSVTVLDPAAGTMTFPATAVRLAAETYKAKHGDGSLDSWIKGHVLRDFYAFELMMAPYAIGHLRMGTLLTELGYTMSPDDRFKLYLTNTLNLAERVSEGSPGLSPLAEESAHAATVKNKQAVLAVMGNPPYSAASINHFPEMDQLMRAYEEVDGKPLKEKKHWLNDDYVKFMRFAQWKIDEAGQGVIGFITNHSWLDNITFRGMRQSLIRSFDELYVLNLHGSSVKEQAPPEGVVDENVFDIMQGVSIAVLVKHPQPTGTHVVKYGDLWGSRNEKYDWLGREDLATTHWEIITPKSPQYFCVPKSGKGESEYMAFPSLKDIFTKASTGILTAWDALATDDNAATLGGRMMRLEDPNVAIDEIASVLHIADRSKLLTARRDLSRIADVTTKIHRYAYRPFYYRQIMYDDSVVWRRRAEVLENMLRPNVALTTCRQTVSWSWQHALVAEELVDDSFISNRSRERTYVFPLYLYGESKEDEGSLHSSIEEESQAPARRPNLELGILGQLAASLRLSSTPEQVFAYVYAVLYSPAYRTRYAEFLKTDFPRIPFTKDGDTFLKLAELGQQLMDLHLMRSPELDNPISRFCGKGDSIVDKVEYDADCGRVSINPTQYFDGVAPDLWTYQIGGYQVLDRWLKDRKGRFLTSADSIHYSRIVTALARTIAAQLLIDNNLEAAGVWSPVVARLTVVQ